MTFFAIDEAEACAACTADGHQKIFVVEINSVRVHLNFAE
jgi:hypothetical protein